ncbi:MAG: alpha/beta hydrolase [Candidatus Micrarchaeota archaeon]
MTFIHAYLPGSKGSGTSLLLLHGTGGDETSLAKVGREVAPRSSILGVRGKVREGPHNRFFRREQDGSFDMADLVFRANELADFVERAKKDYDLRRLVAVGYSNGANMASAILLLRPRTLDGAVIFRGTQPIAPKSLPDLSSKRVLICSGRNDALVQAESAKALASLLREAGADVTVRWLEAGHELAGRDVQIAKEWLAEKFPG